MARITWIGIVLLITMGFSSTLTQAEEIVSLPLSRAAFLDFRFSGQGVKGDAGVRHRNFGNVIAILGFDLTPVQTALQANPGSFIQEVTLTLTLLIINNPQGNNSGLGNRVDATYDFVWGEDSSIDNWDESTITPSSTQWSQSQSQWTTGTSTTVSSFFVPQSDPIGTAYVSQTPELFNMVTTDQNNFATVMFTSNTHVSSPFSTGFYNAKYSSLLEITIVPEPISAIFLGIGAITMLRRRRIA